MWAGGRQRTDPERLSEFYLYHKELRKLFVEGKLEGKMCDLLAKKASALGFCLETGRRFIREVEGRSL